MSEDAPRGAESRALIIVPPEAVIPAEPAVTRLNWRKAAPAPRRRFSLRTPLLILASPFILMGLGVAVFLPPPLRVNPAHVMVIVGRVLGGTRDGGSADQA